MAVVELIGENRARSGKGGARQVRRDGFVPAVLYGGTVDPVSLKIERSKFEVLLRTPGGRHSVIDFQLPSGNQLALIREVQRHPVSRAVIHVDFQRIEEDKPVQVEIPIVLTGVSAGQKIGGVLEHVTREVEARCMPRDIPGRWLIDISHMELGQTMHASDLDIPNVEILVEPERVICVIAEPTKAVEPTTDEEAEGEEAAEAEEGADGEGSEGE